MHHRGTSVFLALLVGWGAATAGAQEPSATAPSSRYEAAKGAYVQGGFAASQTNFDTATIQIDPLLGFTVAQGYRFSSWLAADVEFFWAKRSQGSGEAKQFALTLNGKIYPVALFGSDALDALQPYVVTGLGGGRTESAGPGGGNGPQQSTFVFRLGAGVDWWMADAFGLYGEGSMLVTPGTKDWLTSGGGLTGLGQVGFKFRF